MNVSDDRIMVNFGISSGIDIHENWHLYWRESTSHSISILARAAAMRNFNQFVYDAEEIRSLTEFVAL